MCFEMGHSAGCLCNNLGREETPEQEPKDYRVGFWYCVYGTTVVIATSKQAAELQLKGQLSETGLQGLEYQHTDFDCGAQDAEEI